MNPGDQVTVYTHEKSDEVHLTRSKVGIVLESHEEDSVEVLRVQVFEWNVAPYQVEVRPWPKEAPRDAQGNYIYGGTYWKPMGDDDPDFDSAYSQEQEEPEITDPAYEAEANALRARQSVEEVKARTQAEKDVLHKRHMKEWEDFDTKWEGKTQVSVKPDGKTVTHDHDDHSLAHSATNPVPTPPRDPLSLDPAASASIAARRPPPTVSNSLPKS
jgi:hypothetical protein